MASSFVEHLGKGFWINDSPLRINLVYLINETETLENPEKWLVNQRNYWSKEVLYWVYEGINSELDVFVNVYSKRAKVISNLITNILNKIDQDNEYLSLSYINQLLERASHIYTATTDDPQWTEDTRNTFYEQQKFGEGYADKQYVKHSFQLWLKLLSGKMQSTVSSKIDYWN